MRSRTQTGTQERNATSNGNVHEHRTAKVIELIGASKRSFEEAISSALDDASETIRGIRGAHVENMSVTWADGKISEYKVNLKVAFGIEHSERP